MSSTIPSCLRLALVAALWPGALFGQTPAKPVEPYAQLDWVPGKEAKQSLAELIDALAKIKEPTRDTWSNRGSVFPFQKAGGSAPARLARD